MSVPKWEQRSAPRVQVFLFCVLTAFLALTPNAEARRHYAHYVRHYASAPPSAMAIDLYTGRILYAKNPDISRYPASITKVMTLYLLFDALRDGRLTMRTQLRVSEHAADQSPTKLGLTPGDTISVADAIGAIVTKSANDMAVTVAEALAGSEEEFARRMTQKARTIGMLNTTFRNASGLPNPEQRTTAQDLIILGKNILADHPERSRVFATRYFQYRGETFRNHNTMLFSYEGMEGMKTGFTSAAGFNLLASAHRGDKRVLAVVLGGESSGARNAAMRNILNSSWSRAMTQMSARKSGIQVASLRQPVEVTIEHPRGFQRAHDEKPDRKAVNPDGNAAAHELAVSQPMPQLRRKPDGVSVGVLVASIENGMIVKQPRQPMGRPEYAAAPSDMTTDEPEEKAEAEVAEGDTYASPAPQEIARNEMLAVQTPPAHMPNMSIHYKTVRVAEVQPLDAVSLDAAPVDPQVMKAQAASASRGQGAGAIKLQTVSATERENVRPQKLAAVAVPPEIIDQPGPYYVQVGSFADEVQAAQRLAIVKQTLGPGLVKAHPEFVVSAVLPSGVTMYRARLARFADEAQAKVACKKLRTSGIECWEMRAR